ncbi:MAG: recombinase family protein [Nanoarchaeota archaeon]|nr:recombinase family protein [Nanoarchaeota archaeon]MBU1103916.1 recombinase family protein [Nanoarchaeota archaeon]
MDFQVVGEYVDYASGGESNRPQFQQMLTDARQHKFDLVLILSLDRFSREGILNTLSYL